MTTTLAAFAAARKLVCAVLAGAALLAAAPAAKAAWNAPWKDETRALVIDAYEFNPIDWAAMTSDKRIAAFINKATDGLPPDWNCSKLSGDDQKLCKNRWWKYEVTKELYHTRRAMAKMMGLEWGAYHLARPGNPREQADHFLEFAKPSDDELIALDLEDNSSEWMSLADAEIFADQIRIRTGRYPVLYTNGNTAEFISDNRAAYPLLSRLPLWYARYRADITGRFPTETWPSYALWQFSSMHNCNAKSCPYRVPGAKTDIDVNVSPLTVAELKAAWPFPDLLPRRDDPREPDPSALIAAVPDDAKASVAAVAQGPKPETVPETPESDAPEAAIAVADAAPDAAEGAPLVAAFGPEEGKPRIDPLALLTAAAHPSPAPDRKLLTGSLEGSPHEAHRAAALAAFRAIEPQAFAQGYAAALNGLRAAAIEMSALRVGPDALRIDGSVEGAAEPAPHRESANGTRSRLSALLEGASAAGAGYKGSVASAEIGEETRTLFSAERGGRVISGDASAQTAALHLPDSRVSAAFAATR